LVEEHRDICSAYFALFQELYDYALHTVGRTQDALGLTGRRRIDLAIIDLTQIAEVSPRLKMIRSWRAEGMTFPVIATSAQDYDGLSIETFEAGADDFLRKPYLLGEMHARIQRHIERRSNAAPSSTRVDGVLLPTEPFTFAGAIISPDMLITFPNGRSFKLSAKQVGILHEFFLHAGTLILKDKLIYAAWGADANTNSTSVHQYLHVLRKLFREGGVDLNRYVTPESKVGWRIAAQAISPALV
jgi:DNA-binding response OmpR family regulator